MQVDEQSELETHVGQDRAAVSDKYMPEGACSASNSCWLGRGARARHQLLRRWPSQTHRIRCGASLGPLGPLREAQGARGKPFIGCYGSAKAITASIGDELGHRDPYSKSWMLGKHPRACVRRLQHRRPDPRAFPARSAHRPARIKHEI